MFEHLPPELCKRLLLHLFSYVNDENPESDDPILNALFAPIKYQLKRDLEKWESNIEQRRQAGIKSAEARKAKANEIQRPLTTVQRDSTKSTDTVNVTVNDTVIKKKNIEERKADFEKSLLPHLEKYGKDILNAFYFYWTEHGEKDKKMRFEKQTSFSIIRRLSTWKNNEDKFGSNEKIRSNNRGDFESDTTRLTIKQVENGFE